MQSKKLIVSIRSNHDKTIQGIITPEIIAYVCEKTGLSERQFLDSLGTLQNMGILETQVATVH